MSATASEQLKPERSLMYFFIFETTINTSRSAFASCGPALVVVEEGVAVAVGCDASPTMRRTTGALGAAATDLGAAGAGGGLSRSSRSHASLLGARASTAQASR